MTTYTPESIDAMSDTDLAKITPIGAVVIKNYERIYACAELARRQCAKSDTARSQVAYWENEKNRYRSFFISAPVTK